MEERIKIRRIPLLVITILLLSVLASLSNELESREHFDSPFGFMPAKFDFEHAIEAGAYWDRPFFELFEWGMIEPEPGRFNFHMTDEYIRRAQKYGFHILANIQPFAPWDQKLCHQDLPAIWSPMGPQTKGKPCSIEAYKNFVIKLVERYDGDGKDDMPGLKYPIKYWEVANEATKLFYVNLRLPEHLPPEEEGGPGFSDLSTLVDSSGNLTPLFYAHHTIALKLENFQKVEKIRERVRDKTILEGQYRFLKDNKVVYVLWGRGKLPSEIKGKVKVTDISGSKKILPSDAIRLTDSPIFIEKEETPVYGEQEGATYNGHFETVCYHPLFLFNEFGDCERAMLRSGNVHSADSRGFWGLRYSVRMSRTIVGLRDGD